ncbi:MAG: adenosylmethionine--8-amino-7-oxononanoate transaminase [Gammaproteobacteria bacterium]|jgi:adenosylmethionine---8-amino-7-oxononanoate aminotransferase
MRADDLDFDRQHIWHPYTSLLNPLPVHKVESAEGVRLTLEDGRRVIDGMASWWCVIHGYNHPVLNAAAKRQMERMTHVMFGGLTHDPAIALCRRLVDLTPQPLQHVFLSDSGSVSVEVAMKMAIQYCHGRGRPARRRFLTIRNGYHGDTLGAMSVCDPVNGMHHLFSGMLPQQLFAPAPSIRPDETWDERESAAFAQMIDEHADEIAAVILEPVVQGAGGMRFYHPEYLRHVRQLCDRYGILLIADEIATGFGRTGRLFACEHADVVPDILCVGKALTGGTISLAATLATQEVMDGVCADGQVFMHGPTFMGNPLACAMASASLDLLVESDWQSSVLRIEQQLREQLLPLNALDGVGEARVFGAIGVLEMKEPLDVALVQSMLIERGVWLRPFGKLLYTMPPYVMTEAELATVTRAMAEVAASLQPGG